MFVHFRVPLQQKIVGGNFLTKKANDQILPSYIHLFTMMSSSSSRCSTSNNNNNRIDTNPVQSQFAVLTRSRDALRQELQQMESADRRRRHGRTRDANLADDANAALQSDASLA
jgi:hypothetical protein